MDISEIDKNFLAEDASKYPDIEYRDALDAPFEIYGACFDDDPERKKPYHRLPIPVAEATSYAVSVLAWHTAGIRVRFATDSPYIGIYVDREPSYNVMNHMAPCGSHGFDLLCDTVTEGKFFSEHIGTFRPTGDVRKPYNSILVTRKEGMNFYTISFPLYSSVNGLRIGVKKGCRLEAGLPYRNEKPVVFYGSSVTQGGCSSRPSSCYIGLIGKKYNLNCVNLGFSGSACGEDTMIDYLTSLDPSVFVSDYDYNAPNAEHLAVTLKKLYVEFRKKHPATPFVFISSPLMDHSARSPKCREAVLGVYHYAKEECGDENVTFIDGSRLFDGDMRDSCTVDLCHPTDLGFFRMYEGIGPIVNALVK